jgi:hypothetical protein
MSDSDQRALTRWGQFPTDDSFNITRPASDPCVAQQPWGIDLKVFARNLKIGAIRPQAGTAPPATNAEIGVESSGPSR